LVLGGVDWQRRREEEREGDQRRIGILTMAINYKILDDLLDQVRSANPNNIGDVLLNIMQIRSGIDDMATSLIAETMLTQFRGMVAGAGEGWKLFAQPVLPNRIITDAEIIQHASVERALHELCYGFESLNIQAGTGWGGSSAVRFHLNSIYHFLSSMFLVDKSKPSHSGLPMGGTVIRALHPVGLAALLDRIDALFDSALGERTFGETVLLLRHSHLVHGDFSVAKIEYLIQETRMRENAQQLRLNQLLWDLFYEILLLDLRLKAIFSNLDINFVEVATRFMKTLPN
jgi:hypothetical protein